MIAGGHKIPMWPSNISLFGFATEELRKQQKPNNLRKLRDMISRSFLKFFLQRANSPNHHWQSILFGCVLIRDEKHHPLDGCLILGLKQWVDNILKPIVTDKDLVMKRLLGFCFIFKR